MDSEHYTTLTHNQWESLYVDFVSCLGIHSCTPYIWYFSLGQKILSYPWHLTKGVTCGLFIGCEWLSSDILVMFKWHHYVMSHLRISRNFWEPFFKHKMRYLMVSKKKNLLFMWGWDRKIQPSEASWCQTEILTRVFSIPPSRSW